VEESITDKKDIAKPNRLRKTLAKPRVAMGVRRARKHLPSNSGWVITVNENCNRNRQHRQDQKVDRGPQSSKKPSTALGGLTVRTGGKPESAKQLQQK